MGAGEGKPEGLENYSFNLPAVEKKILRAESMLKNRQTEYGFVFDPDDGEIIQVILSFIGLNL